MKKDINKLIDKIFEKKFKKSLLGYDKDGVDVFLNEIIEFLENLIKLIDENNSYIDQTTKTNLELQLTITKLKKELKEQKKNDTLNELIVDRQIQDLEKRLNELKKYREQ